MRLRIESGKPLFFLVAASKRSEDCFVSLFQTIQGNDTSPVRQSLRGASAADYTKPAREPIILQEKRCNPDFRRSRGTG